MRGAAFPSRRWSNGRSRIAILDFPLHDQQLARLSFLFAHEHLCGRGGTPAAESSRAVAILLSTPRCQVAQAPFCGARDGPRFRGALVAAEPLAIGFA